MRKNASGVLKKLVPANGSWDFSAHFRECFIWNRLACAAAKCGSRESDNLCLMFSAKPQRQRQAAWRRLVSLDDKTDPERRLSRRYAAVRECRKCRFGCLAGQREPPVLFSASG